MPNLAGFAVAIAFLSAAIGTDAQETNLSLPNVTVIAPAPAVVPPYQRDPAKSYARNPYLGRYRVEEDKFREVQCAATRIASSSGGKCLQGYRLTPATFELSRPRSGSTCEFALDVVIFNIGSLAIEADTLIFDPDKLAAIGYQSNYCYVNGYTGYDQEDFQDMNQVTRRGTNWRNLISDGEDKSIEFSDGPHNCAAVKRAGPKWNGGYIYMMHASICRAGTEILRPEDISYALGSLQLRQYDPVGNLRPPAR
jgi:hypothetical protein